MKKNRIAKTLNEKLQDLDSHLYLLRENLIALPQNPAHLKVIAAELRTLICKSGPTEGLLWRLVDELHIDDQIFVHSVGTLKCDHPLAQGLRFYSYPIIRGGKGDPKLPPQNRSFKDILKKSEPIYAAGKPRTYEYLIKAISQQMGTAHEDDGLEPFLVELKSIRINEIESFMTALTTATEFTLEIGERVFSEAENSLDFKRVHHKHDYGNFSLALRLRVIQQLAGRIPLVGFHSYIANVSIDSYAGPEGISFIINKQGRQLCDIVAKYPSEWQPGSEALFVFSYCSNKQQARTLSNNIASKLFSIEGLGWIHGGDFVFEKNNTDNIELVEKKFIMLYKKLLSPEETQGLFDIPSDGYGLFMPSQEIDSQSPFPD